MKRHTCLSLITTAVLVLLAAGCADNPATQTDPAEEVARTTLIHAGDRAPDLRCDLLGGGRFDLADHRGQVVLVNFFATWCKPCQVEMPRLQRDVWERFHGPGFAMVSIAREEAAPVVAPFVAERELTWPFGLDPTRTVYGRYAEAYIPRNFVVAPDGVVVYQSQGYSPEDFTELVAVLERELDDHAADAITEDYLRAQVSVLAADDMAGRGPGTAGDRRARRYLAGELAALGFAPGAADGSYEQAFPIVGLVSHPPARWTFTAGDGREVAFARQTDFMAAAGVQQSRVAIEDAEVVFVGYGIEAAEEGWDDFKGADLRGKILLVLNDDPDWDEALFAGERKLYYGRWSYKYESAARQGAAGAIIVHTTPSAGYPWQVVQTSWNGPQYELPAGDEPRLAVQAWLTEDAATRLVAAGGRELADLVAAARSRDFRPVPLGVTTSLSFAVDLQRRKTANVLGLLPGSDPELAREVVIYSAHHDHLGVGAADADGDTIYNGALDNGVAMAQALGVARAFAALPAPPRRSVLILFPAAEEQGLLGSGYFTRHPPRPVADLVADINFELGNVWGRTRDVMVYGLGKSTLEDRLATLAAVQDRTVVADRDPRAGWYYRSDQFSFARVGVPAIWFKSGTTFRDRPDVDGQALQDRWIATHYHQPCDEVADDWRYDGLVEDARLAFALGRAVADADDIPRWYPGDEFAAVRERSRAGRTP